MFRPFAGAIIWAAIAAAVPAAFVSSQEKPKEINHRVSVNAVTISVTVQDRSGRYVTSLAEGDFTVLENGQPQTLNYFKHAYDAPVSLAVLLDVSGSMALLDRLGECRDALRSVVESSFRPQDELALLTFADGQVEVTSRFSTDKSAFLKGLDSAVAYGQTALYDAVAVSPEFANRGQNEKRALLLMTDGIENDSQASPAQAVEIARRVDVPIFTVGYKIPMSEQLLRKYLRSKTLNEAGIVEALQRFSEATGGKAYFLDTPRALSAALREIAQELAHQYILGYTTYGDPAGGYRKIAVLTSNKSYRVRTRQGY
jgi:Ca-activated chloride channel family protein